MGLLSGFSIISGVEIIYFVIKFGFNFLNNKCFNFLGVSKVVEFASDSMKLGGKSCSSLLLQDPELHAFLISLSSMTVCLLS